MKRIRKPNDNSIGSTNRIYKEHDNSQNNTMDSLTSDFAPHQISNSFQQNHSHSDQISRKETPDSSSNLHLSHISSSIDIDLTREACIQYAALKRKAVQLVDEEERTTLPTVASAKDIASEPITGLFSSIPHSTRTSREEGIYSLLYEPLYACSNSLFYLTPEKVANTGYKMLHNIQKHTTDAVTLRNDEYARAVLSTRSRREKDGLNEGSVEQESSHFSSTAFLLPRIGDSTSHCVYSDYCNQSPTQLLHPLCRNTAATAHDSNPSYLSSHRKTEGNCEMTAFPAHSSLRRNSISSSSRDHRLDTTSRVESREMNKNTESIENIENLEKNESTAMRTSHPPTRLVLHIHPDKKASYTFFLPLKSENVLPKGMIAEKIGKIAQHFSKDRAGENTVSCVSCVSASPYQHAPFSTPKEENNGVGENDNIDDCNEACENDDTDHCDEFFYNQNPLQSPLEPFREWSSSRTTSESHSEYYSEAFSEDIDIDIDVDVLEEGEGRFRSTKRFARSIVSLPHGEMHDGDEFTTSSLLLRKKRKENDSQIGLRRANRRARRQVLVQKSQPMVLSKKDIESDRLQTTNCSMNVEVSTPISLSPSLSLSSSTTSFSPRRTNKHALRPQSFFTTERAVPLLTPMVQFQYTKKSLLQEDSRYDSMSRSSAELPASLRPQS